MKRVMMGMMIVLFGLSAQAGDTWVTVRAGVVYRSDMKIEVSGGTHASQSDRLNAVSQLATQPWSKETVIGSKPGTTGVPVPTDDLSSKSRTFDDGYVTTSGYTDVDPNKGTQVWGYDDKINQYHAGGTPTIDYTRASSASDSGSYVQYVDRVDSTLSQTSARETYNSDDDMAALGAKVDVLLKMTQKECLGVSMVFGAVVSRSDDQTISTRASSLIREDIQSSRTDVVTGYDWTASQTYEETYTYTDYHDVINSLPGNTYSQPDAFTNGPILTTIPSDYDVATTSSSIATTPHSSNNTSSQRTRTWQTESRIEYSSDVTRTTLNAGSEFAMTMTEQLHLVFSPRLTLNWVDISTTRKEYLDVIAPDGTRTTAQMWRDDTDSNKWLPGAMISLGLDYDINECWGIQVMLQREWCFDNASIDIGPSELDFDFDSYNVECTVSWSF
ncbi:MAG: hypothetical protein EOL87_12155 [Spartobacteria bacterium]|nr:hypothetical protein [Spartobacteria bacterium]